MENLSEAEKSEVYKKFQWIPCLDIHNRPWTKEEFSSHINEFKKAEKKLPISYEVFIEQIKPSQNEKLILDVAKKLTYLKDLKDDFRRQGIFYGQKLFEEISKRIGCELRDMSYMLEEEVIDFLDNGNVVPMDIVEERKKGFVIYFTPERKIECKTGNDIKPALAMLGLTAAEEISEEIKGVSASRGRARGAVVIVRGVSDLIKVKHGNILVAVSTHPDYVPAMQRAAAIVTDEGGITSHASIVARELGVPCIVGTKNATKSLKDGDEVDVDAYSGIVRKIRK